MNRPFADMPYGYPPAICYPLTEICMYILFLLCLYHACKQGISKLAYLLGGLGFGLLLEYINVRANAGYRYGHFLLMIGDIPVGIGAGWGIIMYTSRLITESMNMRIWPAAAMEALLALNIDWSMDVVAYRLHMWHWNWETIINPSVALTAQYFGVPWGNFYGWLCVVFFYSLFSRYLEKTRTWKIAIPIFAILISQVALYVTLFPISFFLKNHFNILSADKLVFTLLFFAILTAIEIIKMKRQPFKLPFITWLVPAWFHIYFFCWLFIGGFAEENTWMTLLSVLSLFAGTLIHWLLILNTKSRT
ncbi:carotenoid biosynthesis protein [Chitinophaga sp.]|uniref:carotenoid biosynthesis protein n=1 Tax=Chitinophaga sp. TaxID=1869181 RepID=UPI0031E3B30C